MVPGDVLNAKEKTMSHPRSCDVVRKERCGHQVSLDSGQVVASGEKMQRRVQVPKIHKVILAFFVNNLALMCTLGTRMGATHKETMRREIWICDASQVNNHAFT